MIEARRPLPLAPLLTCAIAAVLAAPSLASAGTGLVAVIGKGKSPDLKRFTTLAETAAKEAGWTLAAAPLDPGAAREASTCIERDRPLPCLASFITPSGADRLLFLKVGAAAEDKAVLQLTAIVVLDTGGAPAISERFCRTCNESQVGAAVHELVRTSIQNAAVTSGRTIVAITASAPGAWIYLDGNLLTAASAATTTRAQAATFPGPHTATVEKAGFQTQILRIDAREGKTTEISADLRANGAAPEAPPTPARAAKPPPPPSPWRRPLGWGLVAAGGASVLVGATLVALDEDQPPLGEPRQPQYFNSARFGVGVMIGGALLTGGGAAYLLLTRPRSPQHASHAASLPTFTPLPGGAAVTWGKAF